MTLEFNLVGTKSAFGNVFDLISRKRIVGITEENQMKVFEEALKFLSDNLGYIESAVTDKELLNLIQEKPKLTLIDFFSLKYLMALSGIDLLVHTVAENETNPFEIKENTREYILVDTQWVNLGFVPMSSKFPVDFNGQISDVFEKIEASLVPFKSEYFGKRSNTLSKFISSLRSTENLTGTIPSNISVMINSILSYLGKELIVINP